MGRTREVELKVGRRAADGVVRLSAYPPQLVQLDVSYKGERSASVLLTQEQMELCETHSQISLKKKSPNPKQPQRGTKLNADPKKLFYPSKSFEFSL